MGPSISDIFIILGKKDTIDRLNQYKVVNMADYEDKKVNDKQFTYLIMRW